MVSLFIILVTVAVIGFDYADKDSVSQQEWIWDSVVYKRYLVLTKNNVT
jgi:hypothetical protein